MTVSTFIPSFTAKHLKVTSRLDTYKRLRRHTDEHNTSLTISPKGGMSHANNLNFFRAVIFSVFKWTIARFVRFQL